MAINDRYFEGLERERWKLIAGGFKPSFPGGRVDYALDQGMAIRNGGISMPREVKLRTGLYYYRFLDTVFHNVNVAKSGDVAYFGRWWIDGETMLACRKFALDGGYALSEAAKYFLALPYEWGDHRRLVRALLAETLRAWEGRGAPAQSAPAQSNRAHRMDRGTTWIPPQHVEVHQLFIPGTPEEIRKAFASYKCEYADKADFWSPSG
jgi:hypothetical protein